MSDCLVKGCTAPKASVRLAVKGTLPNGWSVEGGACDDHLSGLNSAFMTPAADKPECHWAAEVHYAKRGESVVRTFVFESDTPIAQLGARDGSWTAFAEDTSVRMAKVLGPRQPGDRVLGVFIRRAQLAQHWPTVKERSWLARQLARWLDYLEA